MKIVIHPALEPERLEVLIGKAPEVEFINAADELIAYYAMPDADAFLGKITPELLGQAHQLRWVQAFTVSLEHYMFHELIQHPCTLTNMRGLFGDVIADQVMGYVLCFARNLHHYIRKQAEHKYEPLGGEENRVNNASGPGVVNGMDRATIYLPDTTMGIIGFGAIGADIARRALAFGIKVRAVDRFPDKAQVVEGVPLAQDLSHLPELLGQSDFVVIAAPQTPETTGFFNTKQLELMKPKGYLINIGRGKIVVLDDLVEALRFKKIAGAALDVFEVEPLPADHALWDFPNVIITPHTAGYSPIIARRHLATLIDNIERFVRGEPLQNQVNKPFWC